MLKQEDVVPLLLRRRLISEEQIVAGALAVVNVSRRNHNFKIISDRGPCYFIKQGVGAEKARTVGHEADVYLFLREVEGAHKLLRLLPGFCSYDAEESILILEAERDARSLMEYHSLWGRFSKRLASVLGNALSAFHSLTATAKAREEYSQKHESFLPLALYLHRPDVTLFRYASQGSLDLIKMVQQSHALCESLDRLYVEWQIESLIHGDIRWDNCSVFRRSSPRGRAGIKIVDWELACLGDPCWDVGTIFSEYLNLWLRSAPISGGTPPEEFLKFARYPIERMQPAIRSFWDSYVGRAGTDLARKEEWLLRSVRYAAARLVQTAFERVQEAVQVTGQAVCLLQLGTNILERPREASVQLFGIPLQQESG